MQPAVEEDRKIWTWNTFSVWKVWEKRKEKEKEKKWPRFPRLSWLPHSACIRYHWSSTGRTLARVSHTGNTGTRPVLPRTGTHPVLTQAPVLRYGLRWSDRQSLESLWGYVDFLIPVCPITHILFRVWYLIQQYACLCVTSNTGALAPENKVSVPG